MGSQTSKPADDVPPPVQAVVALQQPLLIPSPPRKEQLETADAEIEDDDDYDSTPTRKRARTIDSSSSSGLVCLNVRNTLMELPRSSLLEIPWFEALLCRWSSSSSNNNNTTTTRDRHGNLYIDDDPELFKVLLHHARNVSRPSPLALTLTTPSFIDKDEDETKEQEFRLMVDQYGLTQVFYSFEWYQAEWICTEGATRCEITSIAGARCPLVLPFACDQWAHDKAHVIKTGNKHNRRIQAFECQIGDASKMDWLDIGWMSECNRKTYKVRLFRLSETNERQSIKYTCMEEDLNSVGETKTDSDSIEFSLRDESGSTILRLERDRMKFSMNGTLFWSAGDTPADDLVPWIYHCGEDGSGIEITKIELDN
jgi:hypothetical protein